MHGGGERDVVRAAIVAAARLCVGTPFRPQGRKLGIGLDCVGVVLLAAEAVGLLAPGAGSIAVYRLGGDHGTQLLRAMIALGCVETGRPRVGDVAVFAPRPRQRHLGILTPVGLVHAHAGLGRVVEGPASPDWANVGVWRLPGVS